MDTASDRFTVYQILSRLTQPFSTWPAFSAGIIDANGTVLKKRATLSPAQQAIWGYTDILCCNLKKILNKYPQLQAQTSQFGNLAQSVQALPFGLNMPLGTLASTLFLLKESNIDADNLEFLEQKIIEYTEYIQRLVEDGEGGGAVPANNIGGGNIAGTGIGPQGEPGVYDPGRRKYQKGNKKAATAIGRQVTNLVGFK